MIRIGIDLMGSDSCPSVLFKGVERAFQVLLEQKEKRSVQLHVYHTKQALTQHPPLFHEKETVSQSSIFTTLVPNFIEMQEPPLRAIRQKREASSQKMLQDLRDGKIDAAISAGNTGALIAGSAVLLQSLPNIHRPALLAIIPSENGGIATLDVGGFVEPKTEHLVQFAKMGAAYQRAVKGIDLPKVGLLNIGAEQVKGTGRVQEAFVALQKEEKISFLGNIEGKDLFHKGVDVIVTDGFTGNVFLKTVEGVSNYLLDRIHVLFEGEDEKKTIAAFVDQAQNQAYTGAIVVGVQGLVIKCHGNSCADSMANAIVGAKDLIDQKIISKISCNIIE